MTPGEQGRHCAVCSKVVKDYTQMNTSEIIDTLKKSDGEVCGRINITQVTPVSKKQKIYFLINGWIYRKAVYPVMALLGFTIISKKAFSQGHAEGYPLKGKVAYQDYYTSNHKVTIVVKNKSGDVIPDANLHILNSKTLAEQTFKTDKTGMVLLTMEANDIIGDFLEVEILANGYEYKLLKIRLNKSVQKIEVRMEQEVFIMGEMAYVEPINDANTNPLFPSEEKIEIIKCDFATIKNLPQIPTEVTEVDFTETQMINPDPNYVNPLVVKSNFTLFPVPSNDKVTIVSNSIGQFNLEIFDSNGKKIHSLVNGVSRYTLDVTNYAAGIYYVLITMDGKVVDTQKMIVTK